MPQDTTASAASEIASQDRPTFWGRATQNGVYRWVLWLLMGNPLRHKLILIGLPLLWLLTQHLGPILQMLQVSLVNAYPVAPGTETHYTLDNYRMFFEENIFFTPFFRTLTFAATLTFATLVLTYPVAYFLARHVRRENQMVFLLLLLIPFWVGEIVRTFAVMILLGNNGAVNLVLKLLGLVDRPVPFMYTGFSVGFGIIYLTALYMLLPLYSALEKLPRSYGEAAADLGAGPWRRFFRVTLPLSLEGVASGCTLVFLISTGYYGAPVLLGGPNTTLFAETIAGFFHVAGDKWPAGAAFACLMFVTALGLTRIFMTLMERIQKRGRS